MARGTDRLLIYVVRRAHAVKDGTNAFYRLFVTKFYCLHARLTDTALPVHSVRFSASEQTIRANRVQLRLQKATVMDV